MLLIAGASDDSMTPPEFSQGLSNKTVKDGECFEISCTIKGDPEPQVTWTKNGKVSIFVDFISKTQILTNF